MIRFRFTDDERRFIRLHAELFEKLARAGFRDASGSELLRNVGKIEQMAFMEGIRQGLAIATLAQKMLEEETGIPEPTSHKAFQLHALVYGSSDTPLRATEKEWLKKLDLEEDHLAKSWLDDKPMRFAPVTNRELDGTEPPVAPMFSVQAATKPMPVASPKEVEDFLHTPLPKPEAMHGAEVTPPEPHQKGEYEADDDADLEATIRALLARKDSGIVKPEAADPDAPESPDFLDRVRDVIQSRQNGGWDPKSWQDLILGLHQQMSVDASYLDLQLSTHFGRTVLDQCGLIGLAPPEMLGVEFFTAPPGKQVPPPVLVTRTESGEITDTPPGDDDIPF